MLPYKQLHSISIGPVNIYYFGIFAALGFLVMLFLALYYVDKRKLDREHVYNLSFAVLLGGIVGGRIGYIITNLDQFRTFFDLLATWNGGLSFHGGFVGALILCIAYMIWKKIKILDYLDLFALAIPLGYAVTRLGCYFAGDHLGKVTNAWYAIYYSGAPRHPIAIYHIFFEAFLTFLIIWHIDKKGKLFTIRYFKGMYFSLMIMLLAALRFIVEFFREEKILAYGLHLAHYVTILMFLGGLIMFFICQNKAKLEKHNKLKSKSHHK